MLAGARTDFDDVVRGADEHRVVLDGDDGVPGVTQLGQGLGERRDLAEVEPRDGSSRSTVMPSSPPPSTEASFTRWASPAERVQLARSRWRYPSPTCRRKRSRRRMVPSASAATGSDGAGMAAARVLERHERHGEELGAVVPAEVDGEVLGPEPPSVALSARPAFRIHAADVVEGQPVEAPPSTPCRSGRA